MSVYHSTFVSHAHADNDLCDRYVNALRARGIDIWYDRNNAQNGHFLGEQIQQELTVRSAFVLLMTEASLKSFWVRLERESYLGLMANDPSRILLAVRIGPCQPPPMVNAFVWIDALAMSFDQAIDTIAAALATVGPPPPPLPRDTLPPLGPAPAPANSTVAHHLTPMSLYNLGFRGYSVNGVECILPPICFVPAGVFTMGSDKSRDPDTLDCEMPQNPVFVDGFAISQHPVTVAEYACAVRAGAVRELPPVGEWLFEAEFDALFGYDRPNRDWQTQLQQVDHPVVYCAWIDAMAYISWLANLSGQSWRLPTEAEWEKSARGTDGRIYPWGNRFEGFTFNQRLCSTGVRLDGRTTPVGSYPAGESPYHVQDLVGYVLQWTSSIDKPYPYRQDDGRESCDSNSMKLPRVIRGSWGSSRSGRQAYVAATQRHGVLPTETATSHFGFRLALDVRVG